MEPSQNIGHPTVTPDKVVPLVQALTRVEEYTSALMLRLDPIIRHEQEATEKPAPSNTITGRLHSVGDGLQYLLDHLEL